MLEVKLDVHPQEVVEPGADVIVEARVQNTGDVPLVLVWIGGNNVYLDPNLVHELPIELAPGEVWEHVATGFVGGGAGDVQQKRFAVTATDTSGETTVLAEATADVHVVADEAPPEPDEMKLEIECEATPAEVPEPGAEVRFRVRVKNEGDVLLKLVSLIDSIFLEQAVVELQTPVELAPGAVWEHVFVGLVEGAAGDVFENVLTVTASDASGETMIFAAATGRVLIKAPHEIDDDPPQHVIDAVIGDWVWHDANRDGVQSEGETGIEGVTVRLYARGSGELLRETVSGADGIYQFEGDFPAKVYLGVVVPDGYALTRRSAGEDRALDSDLDPVSGRSKQINLAETEDDGRILQHATEWDVGLVEGEGGTGMAGVAGPGYWKNHPDQWPLDHVTVGGIEYSKAEAVAAMTNGADKSQAMFRELVTALLNVAAGNSGECVAGTVAEADAWVEEHPPGSEVRPNSPDWQEEGAALFELLGEYNGGKLCAPARDESHAPAEISAGFSRHGQGVPKGLKLRATAQAGRSFMLQKSADLSIWQDVQVLHFDYGVLEYHGTGPELEPNLFYRLVLVEGPARPEGAPPRQRGAFLQLGNGQTEALEPWVYEGDLQIKGNGNQVFGAIDPDGFGTVVAGDLIIQGSANEVFRLTVKGNTIIRGNGNRLVEVDCENEVIDSGKGNEY